jgi:hypothetical protein
MGHSLGLKWPELRVNHPPPYIAEVKEKVELYFYTSVCLHGGLYDEFDLLYSN